MKKKIKDKEGLQLDDFLVQLKLPSKDGKEYLTDCANVENTLRIIQSIPSPKAEPFKHWLAKTGFERIQEIQNPELAIKRAILEYELQGRDKKWIQDRIENIVVRNNLTTEWKDRDINNHNFVDKRGNKISAYGILTDAI